MSNVQPSGKVSVATMLAVDTRVVLVNEYVAEDKKHIKRKGKVVGHAIIPSSFRDYTRAIYLIELDRGFYAPEGDMYIQIIPVDSEGVEKDFSICPPEKHFGRADCGCSDQPRMP